MYIVFVNCIEMYMYVLHVSFERALIFTIQWLLKSANQIDIFGPFSLYRIRLSLTEFTWFTLLYWWSFLVNFIPTMHVMSIEAGIVLNKLFIFVYNLKIPHFFGQGILEIGVSRNTSEYFKNASYWQLLHVFLQSPVNTSTAHR